MLRYSVEDNIGYIPYKTNIKYLLVIDYFGRHRPPLSSYFITIILYLIIKHSMSSFHNQITALNTLELLLCQNKAYICINIYYRLNYNCYLM